MKGKLTIGAIGIVMFGAMAGCQNTAEGMKQDTAEAGQKAAEVSRDTVAGANKAVGQVSEGVSEAAKDTSAAVVVTPLVKSAITADKELNDTGNLINVESKDNVVRLTGNVKTEALKKKAGDIAQKTLTDNKSTDKLSNELTVGGG